MSDSAQSRSRLIPRMIGLLNLTIAFVGLMHLALTMSAVRILGMEFIQENGSLLLHRLEYMSAATILFLVPLGVLGYLLYRGRTNVTRLSIIFFASEALLLGLLVWRWDFVFSPFSFPVVMTGLMNFGILVQIVTAYPIVCLILLAREARQSHSHAE